MNFVISSSALSMHLMTIGRVIVQKNTLPILDCFCFDIKDNILTITASDNDSTLTTSLELNECSSNARFAVNAKTLQDAIKEIPEQPLEFEFNPSTYEVTVIYQNGQYRLMAQDAENYPELAITQEERINLNIDAQVLYLGISRSLVAAANDVLRPQLNSVCFDIKDNSVSMVSSNGNHLALTKVEMDSIPQEGTFLLNTRPASLLRNILAKEQGEVQMSFGARSAIFTSEGYSMTCRLIEGKYPNYRSVIPQNNPNIVTLNRASLISVLRRVLVFANPTALVKFRLDSNTMNISTQDIEFGKSAEENILCEYVGTPMRIAFKGSTFIELIQNIQTEDISIQVSDPSRAGIIVPSEQSENEEILMLIMPSVIND